MNFKTFNLFRFDFGFVMVKIKLKGCDLKKCSPFTTSLSFVSIFLSLSLSPISYSLILSQSLSFLLLFERACLCVCVVCCLALNLCFPTETCLWNNDNASAHILRALGVNWFRHRTDPSGQVLETKITAEKGEREKKKIGQLLFTIDLQFLSSRSQWPFVSGHPIGSLTNRNCVGDWNERFDWLRSSSALKCNGRKQDG